MSACLSADTLARLAEGDAGVDPGEEEHARECAVCARHLSLLRACLALGVDEISEETQEVDALLRELWTEREWRWGRMVSDPRFHRPSLARRMLALALVTRESDTRLALGYSSSAIKIVEALSRDPAEIADLRFDAWRYHANLLRELGAYGPCRDAFVSAEQAAQAATDAEASKALVDLSRALLVMEPDVWEPTEGLALLQSAERVFEKRGDRERLIHVRTVRGMLAIRAGNPVEAASIFAEILAVTSREHENRFADAQRNYLWAIVHAGGADDEILEQIGSLEMFDERREAHINILRDRWMRGLVGLARGRLNEAVALLRNTMRGFDAKGHADTSIRVGIDAVRALLVAQRYEECVELARDLASRAVGLDQREPKRRRALTAEAVSYLRDAAQHEILTPDLAQSIARYVDQITHQRPLDFVPPMPLHQM